MNLETSYLNLPEVMYARVAPTPVAAPRLLVLNEPLTTDLGIELSSLSRDEQAALFAGNLLPKNAQPLAQAYAGHQFGNFAMLGDGRAHLIGEQITPAGERVDIQLKGSGRTPYSRSGDGRAVLGPMLREYLMSEAMAALGIPTTRALAVVTTGETVQRETRMPGAIFTRVAASHLRVGTFEFAAAQQDQSLLETLLRYTIDRHFPALIDAENQAIALLDAVIQRQADLIVHWMRVGFIHGVMNTDNTAISGETIDYGPCAFMDAYDPNTVFSAIDHAGRYAYANQPAIALWNLSRLAEALLSLIDTDAQHAVELAEASLNKFPALYREKWLTMMRAKLGLFGSDEDDLPLISDLLAWMQKNHVDYTHTFHDLSNEGKPTGTRYECKDFSAWHERCMARRERNAEPVESSLRLMKATNPAVIPRNHKVEEALDAATAGNTDPFHDLLAALRSPYDDREALKPYQSLPEPGEGVHQTFCGT